MAYLLEKLLHYTSQKTPSTVMKIPINGRQSLTADINCLYIVLLFAAWVTSATFGKPLFNTSKVSDSYFTIEIQCRQLCVRQFHNSIAQCCIMLLSNSGDEHNRPSQNNFGGRIALSPGTCSPADY